MKRIRGLFRWAFLLTLTYVPSLGASQCDDWGKPSFFDHASASLVATCLEEGASIRLRTDDGQTPLHLAAAYSSDPEVIHLLVSAGADPAAREADGWTPMHMAASMSDWPQIVVALALHGAEVDSIVDPGPRQLTDRIRFRSRGVTPLMIATQHSRPHALISALIAAGADTNAMDINGRRPMHHAARDNEDATIVALLIASGGNINAADRDSWTPLHLAATRNRNPKVAETLIRHGADPDATAKGGHTPIQQAAGHNTAEVVRILLRHASKPCATDRDGRMAFRLAESNPMVFGTKEYWELHNLCYAKQ